MTKRGFFLFLFRCLNEFVCVFPLSFLVFFLYNCHFLFYLASFRSANRSKKDPSWRVEDTGCFNHILCKSEGKESSLEDRHSTTDTKNRMTSAHSQCKGDGRAKYRSSSMEEVKEAK